MIFSDLKFKLAERNIGFFGKEVRVPKKKLAIVLDTAEKVRVGKFLELMEDMKITAGDFKIIVVTEECPADHEVLRFCGDDISWTGKILKEEILEVLRCQFDVLLAYVEEMNDALDFIVDNCSADLKIGRPDNTSGRYDLTIFSSLGEVEVFTEEVKKYLNSLKGITL